MARKVWKRKKGTDLNTKLNNEHHYANKTCECYFRDLEEHFISYIEASEQVVLCVAWLTSQKVLKAIVDRPSVLILRNESWLNKKGGLAKKARDLYGKLRSDKDTFMVLKEKIEKDILVCGMISHPQNMHHKFAVRLDKKGKPLSVWTGSFNPTKNGNESLENALVLHNPKIAEAYAKEFLGVRAISKPLKV